MTENIDVSSSSILKSFAWKFLERLFSQGVNIIVQIVLARILMPEHFGSLAIISAVVNYANIFVQSGISTTIIQRKDLERKDVSTLLTMSLAVALFLYLVVFFAAPFFAGYYGDEDLILALRVLCIMLFFNAVNSVQSAMLMRQMKFKNLFYRNLLSVPVSGVVGLILALLGYGIWALIAQQLVSAFVIMFYMSLDKSLRFPLGFSLSRLKSLYAFTVNILLTSIVTGFHDFLRTLIIGKKYTKSDLAYYDKAIMYSQYFTQLVITSAQSVLLPSFSRNQTNIDALKQMARRSVQISGFIMIPVLLLLASTSDGIVRFLLTEKWLGAVPFLMIYCLLRIVGCIVVVDKQVYFSLGKSKIMLHYELMLFTINLITLLITMRISVLAIAVGALVVEYIGCFILFLVSSKVFHYSLKERFVDLHKSCISSIIMVFVIHMLSNISCNYLMLLIVQITIGVFIYLISSYLLKDQSLFYIRGLLLSRLKKQ